MGQGIYCSTLLLLGIFAQILFHVQSKCRSVNCVYYDRISLNLHYLFGDNAGHCEESDMTSVF